MKSRKKLTLEQGMYITGLVAFIVGLPLLLYYTANMEKGMFPPCILNRYLGVYCPGCGGSRALKAFFTGHFLASLYYHPLVMYTAVIYIVFMVSQTLQMCSRGRIRGIRFHHWFLYGAVIVIAVNCLLKNILKFVFGITLM